MSVITLLTDFGYRDNFVGVVKGVILGINPKAHIIDLCHEVDPQDIMSAAFSLKTAYKYFPKNTVHLVVIDPGVGSERLPMLVKTKDYFFIGPDNGVLSLALEAEKIEGIIYLDNPEFYLMPVSHTFHARDIFAPVAAQLTKGISYQLFGKSIKDYKKIILPKPKISSHSIKAEIVYIDRFGNLFTNISQSLENKINPSTTLRVDTERRLKSRIYKAEFDAVECIKNSTIKIKDKIIKGTKSSYAQVKPHKLLAIFDSSGFLEIALNLGSAKNKLKAKVGDKVEITNLSH